MQKVKQLMGYLIIFGLPVMKIIEFSSGFKYNIVFSDLIIPIYFLISLLNRKKLNIKINIAGIWFFLGLILISAISDIFAINNPNINSKNTVSLIFEIIKFIISASYFIVGFNMFDNLKEFKKVISFWLYSSMIIIIVGFIIQISFYMGIQLNLNNALQEKSRFLGTLTDANKAASYLTISFFLAFLYLKISNNKKERNLAILVIMLSAISTILTMSRAGVAGLAISCIILVAINISLKGIKLQNIIIYTLVMVIFVFLLINIDYSLGNGRFTSNFTERFNSNFEQEAQITVRSDLWKTAWEMGKHNILLGVGRGNFVENSEFYANQTKSISKYYPNLVPHNTFLGIFAEMGLIGLLWFLIMPLLLAKKLYENRKYRSTSIFLCMYIALFIQSLSINIENFRALWFIIGLTLAINFKDIVYEKFYELNTLKIIKKRWIPVLILAILVLYIDTGRKIPFDGGISKSKKVIISNISSKDKYVLHYYIKYSQDKIGTPINISLKEIKKNDNNFNSVEYNYLNANGFVNQQIKLEDISKLDVLLNLNNTNNNLIIKDMYLENQKNNEKILITHKTQILPLKLENLLNKFGLLNNITSEEEELFSNSHGFTDDDIIKDLKIERKGLYSNQIQYTIDDNSIKDERIEVITSIVEQNINNIKTDNKNGIIGFRRYIDKDENGRFSLIQKFDCSDYDEDYKVYISIKTKNGIKYYKIDNPTQSTVASVTKNLSKVEEVSKLISTQINVYSTGYIESEPIILSNGKYRLEVTCKGSEVDGIYPLVKVTDNDQNIIQDDFSITGEYKVYEFENIQITEDETLKSFLIYFLNDSYYNKDGVVKDRNLFIQNMTLTKIE